MIVVGIDDRPSARDALVLGRWLADAQAEELLPAWVHPYDPLPSILGNSPEQADLRRAVEALTDDVRATLPPGLGPALRLVSGSSPAHGLEQLAESERASLIVLGASERAGVGRVLPGATGLRLLSGSTVPVAIAPRGYTEGPKPEPVIGVGFDGGPESRDALEWAAALASEVGGQLRIVAVNEPIAFGNVSAGVFPVESVGQALRRELQDALAHAEVSLVNGPKPEQVLADGDPASELVKASAELDMLVLGSRGYGPLRSVLLGSVSQATVADSAAPVVVVPRSPTAD